MRNIAVHLRLTPEILAHARQACYEHDLSQTLSHAEIVRSLFLVGLEYVKPGSWTEQPDPAHMKVIAGSNQLQASTTGRSSVADQHERIASLVGSPAQPAHQRASARPNPLQHLSELDPADRAPARNLWAWAMADASGPDAALLADIEEASSAGDERRERIARWLLDKL